MPNLVLSELKAHVDRWGNTHFLKEGALVASYYPNILSVVHVNTGDENFEEVKVDSDGPMFIIYRDVIQVDKPDVTKWFRSLNPMLVFSGIAAINGIVFYADLFPLGGAAPSAMGSSDLDTMHGNTNQSCAQVKALFIEKSGIKVWDEGLVDRARHAPVADFLNKHLND
jgi:hypothetical protein